MNTFSPHTFHIPVMGLAYTIDSPVKVARFGISSVISIVEDRLVEMMRSYYYPETGRSYHPITIDQPDYRARRITDYLNLVNSIVREQVEKIKKTAFEKGSEIVTYFEMLPEQSVLKQLYRQMTETEDQAEKRRLENYLRNQVTPGSIDVNIMTKIDRDNLDKDNLIIKDGSDAVASLRGYINSDLTNSSIVFSAGMNPRLYNYLEQCSQFDMNEDGTFSKKIILKVSDFRSALIQGKYLAKKGIWVSEFRIESGLNCGGHAFATDGFLLGPILEEFKTGKQELIDILFELYSAAQLKKNNKQLTTAPPLRFSVQGGIGTAAEDKFLHSHYQMETTGWGSPFLLVPEATTVDDETLKLLTNAKEEDVVLSRNSPLGVRFHYLKGTSSDKEKQLRIKEGRPGSPCTEKHLALNKEFNNELLCTASRKYQQLKIRELKSSNLPEPEYQLKLADVLDKECLCVGLSNAASLKYSVPFLDKLKSVNVCPGPNIAHFSKVVSLRTMVDHIYGRSVTLTPDDRPHMFINELSLYIDYLKEKMEEDKRNNQFDKRRKYYDEFYLNLRKGIQYYRQLASEMEENTERFLQLLGWAETELDVLNYKYSIDYN
ncbi:MAG: hypothetical protein IPN39_10625 [Chitinophagaceae bacterium]|nr:hypothetical protein [Chitinophagaceae bacterium]MBK9381773.1 hypothetical protein [Chitinophagaceae bacterium]MBL0304882.1 hypothetical protein [Chitinophagaceae bacterium]MBP6214568.1 hypothetical protein [Chitinophagaceae bacterium]MBP6417230.1 hypothetical protein [Chitinophagaceae bacterium]